MKFEIIYEIPSASGIPTKKLATAYTKQEAEDICKAIESIGYKLIDISRARSEYGE